jgi:hypothetical protein
MSDTKPGPKVEQCDYPKSENHAKLDQLGKMIAWEDGSLSDESTIELFQELIDSGLAWQLQGCYGRFANKLIDAGYCEKPTK